MFNMFQLLLKLVLLLILTSILLLVKMSYLFNIKVTQTFTILLLSHLNCKDIPQNSLKSVFLNSSQLMNNYCIVRFFSLVIFILPSLKTFNPPLLMLKMQEYRKEHIWFKWYVIRILILIWYFRDIWSHHLMMKNFINKVKFWLIESLNV